MYLGIVDDKVPGTVLLKKDMDGSTGLEFLDKIFYLKDGIMLSQVRDITGLEGSTLQNWVKRGWIANTVNKLYTKDNFARILIIKMLRDAMHLADISLLLKYINGVAGLKTDDIIPESLLYDYICRITDSILDDGQYDIELLRRRINDCIRDEDLNPLIPGAHERLAESLEIIITARYAALIKAHSDAMLEKLKQKYESEVLN
ncbi:MAG: DUF1836 domain-containing protein [Clostridiales bacterium]|nr:DUF1836 domain-containing protein [Clostridiales bacterium]